jgi:hypothetical protein
MKSVPPEIEKLGTTGTAWFGGPADLLRISLRVHALGEERAEVSRLLGRAFEPTGKYWRVTTPEVSDGDLDAALSSLLATLNPDLATWRAVTSKWSVNIFCGVFLERPNRGIELGVEAMRLLSERGIRLGFDIYAPDGSKS